jgi:hypothetical protein
VDAERHAITHSHAEHHADGDAGTGQHLLHQHATVGGPHASVP